MIECDTATANCINGYHWICAKLFRCKLHCRASRGVEVSVNKTNLTIEIVRRKERHNLKHEIAIQGSLGAMLSKAHSSFLSIVKLASVTNFASALQLLGLMFVFSGLKITTAEDGSC